MLRTFYYVALISVLVSCSKSGGEPGKANTSPAIAVTSELVSTNPFTFRFKAQVSDADGDPVVLTWNFGNGTTRKGAAEETATYDAGQEFTVQVVATDGKSTPSEASVIISTKITTVTIDLSKKFQTMEGFGGFGSQREYWSGGPFTSDEFVNTLVNDLGLTILRDNLPTSFEVVNDNDDPFNTNLAGFNLSDKPQGHDETMNDHLEHLRKMKQAGLEKLIVSIWSPAPWMKYNNGIGNGTQNQNSAPPYTRSPTTSTNQLKTTLYDEFAELCVAYIKILKRETGIDVYAISLQNEPRFSQFYASAVYDGAALRDVIKVVGKRFADEGITTKIFLPEDVGWLQGVESMVKPTLDDPEARKYVSIVAVHGYDLDGITAASPAAQTWITMHNWGAPYGLPLWMTETSGFENSHKGAMDLAKAMYTAINFGQVSAWVFWSLSTTNLDAYSLMSSSGTKSKRYYVSKNFYRYIRPGATRIEAVTQNNINVLSLGFRHAAQNTHTLVLINDSKTAPQVISLSGANLPAQWKMYVTSETENTKDFGTVLSANSIVLPPASVTTLYSSN